MIRVSFVGVTVENEGPNGVTLRMEAPPLPEHAMPSLLDHLRTDFGLNRAQADMIYDQVLELVFMNLLMSRRVPDAS